MSGSYVAKNGQYLHKACKIYFLALHTGATLDEQHTKRLTYQKQVMC